MPAAHRVGPMLQYWRKARHMSQLALAHEAEVSARHVCFIETGRARPSREMVLLLASALDVPLRERNALLVAAGFAPVYAETALSSPELAPVRAAIDAILRQQRPYPAVVLDRHWDLVSTNDCATRFFAFLLEGTPASRARGTANVLRLIFDPGGLRPFITNWDAVAESLIQRAHREAVGGVPDAGLTELLDEILDYPGVPRRWRRPDLGVPLVPIVPVCFERAGRQFSYYSTVTVLGTPQDITLQEIRLECFFPVDAETERLAAALASEKRRAPAARLA